VGIQQLGQLCGVAQAGPGHAGGRRNDGVGGSPMGRVYRETTSAMLARVTAALDERIGRAMGVAGSPLCDAEGSAGAQAG
jgi:hypothetical protein